MRDNRYFLTFTDDYSRYIFLYFLSNKSEVPQCFKEFITGSCVKVLRSDNETEFTNNAMKSFSKGKGLVETADSSFKNILLTMSKALRPIRMDLQMLPDNGSTGK